MQKVFKNVAVLKKSCSKSPKTMKIQDLGEMRINLCFLKLSYIDKGLCVSLCVPMCFELEKFISHAIFAYIRTKLMLGNQGSVYTETSTMSFQYFKKREKVALYFLL